MSDFDWETAIAEVQGEEVIIRGYPLSELIGKISYTDMVFLIFTGELPSKDKSSLLEAIFVSVAEHGISPSTIITRTLASCGTPIQASIAGGVLSIADWHGGSCENLAKLLYTKVQHFESSEHESETYLNEIITETVSKYRAKKEYIEGFGHPQHPNGDPRAKLLINYARKLQVDGVYTQALTLLGEELYAQSGRNALKYPNITGAMASLLLDLGFPWNSVRGFVITPRIAGLTAHVVEELDQGSRWRHVSGSKVNYTGPVNKSINNSRGMEE